jgi:hypothetical protein
MDEHPLIRLAGGPAGQQAGGPAGRRARLAGCHQAARLLLDEMLSPAVAREFRGRGDDVLAIAWVAFSDPEVMAALDTSG